MDTAVERERVHERDGEREGEGGRRIDDIDQVPSWNKGEVLYFSWQLWHIKNKQERGKAKALNITGFKKRLKKPLWQAGLGKLLQKCIQKSH